MCDTSSIGGFTAPHKVVTKSQGILDLIALEDDDPRTINLMTYYKDSGEVLGNKHTDLYYRHSMELIDFRVGGYQYSATPNCLVPTAKGWEKLEELFVGSELLHIRKGYTEYIPIDYYLDRVLAEGQDVYVPDIEAGDNYLLPSGLLARTIRGYDYE